MNSAPAQLLYGLVMHRRLRPQPNQFMYPVCYVRVNLARLDACSAGWFGVNRWRPLSLRTRDYGPRDGSSLEQWMRALLREHGIRADGDIWLQTFPRVFGFVFNPVSFWQCHDASGQLRAVLAEVNNTFGERHRYLLQLDSEGSAQVIKHMHVSPFCPLEGEYRFRFRLSGAHPSISIDYHDAQGLLLKTALSGSPLPLQGAAARQAVLRFPLLGLPIVARINWQALRLWRQRAPFFRKPAAPAHPITTTHEETVR